VAAGDLAGFLHFVEDVDRAPIEVRYGSSGVLWMSAGPGRVRRGDPVAVVMSDYEDPATGDGKRAENRDERGRAP
jgi:N-alpha-acetyl-L-2,4-diaminobutyrate deacetylase